MALFLLLIYSTGLSVCFVPVSSCICHYGSVTQFEDLILFLKFCVCVYTHGSVYVSAYACRGTGSLAAGITGGCKLSVSFRN